MPLSGTFRCLELRFACYVSEVPVGHHMTKSELKRSMIGFLANRLRGLWWWADDEDNPFGVALLVCPHPAKPAHFHHPPAHAELYTFQEACDKNDEKEVTPKFVATHDRRLPLSIVGWVIRENGRLTTWTLPPRFEYDNAIEEITRRYGPDPSGKD